MNIILNKEPFHYIEVYNLFTEEETTSMFNEMLHHEQKKIFLAEDETGGATDVDNPHLILKKNKGYFWDELYRNRNCSDILKINPKLFDDVFNSDEIQKNSWYFRNMFINMDKTLISYYENSDYYNPHSDKSMFTALTWFYKEPKSFTGGDLVFSEYNIAIPCQKNYTIIFPSQIQHSVTPVEMDKELLGKGYGRFTMSQFSGQLDG